ncbi:hypothetical protein [Hymenobacter bucti]|uniref:T9SS type A sorting domain-containing protein n=1 Tax=Hymenobacter bucti TaxID=1844114 RepID=A0ABW4QNV8_9BACT
MKVLFTCAGALLFVSLAGHAQTKPAPKPAPATAKPAAAAAKPAPAAATAADAADPAAPTTPVPIALAPVTPAADPNALKIKADINPITHKLTVRCDAVGPTRVEINDKEGRPVLTKTMMAGTTPVVLNTAKLPAGPYVVRCTAGEKTGMRRVMLGD